MTGDGPPTAKVLVVGEAWGETEEAQRRPFVGASGDELNRMLQEAGMLRSEVYCSNLINARPPGNDLGAWIAVRKKDITNRHVAFRDKFVLPIIHTGFASLLREINLLRPNVIIPLGNYAMWALTGRFGILKWRGSQLYTEGMDLPKIKVVPTIHPAAILREYSLRTAAIHDLKRAAAERGSADYSNVPEYKFIIRPSLGTVLEVLSTLAARAETEGHIWVEFDLETSPVHITCAGISWSRTEALCIPITCSWNAAGYWTEDEEAIVVYALYRFLTNPRVWVRGQNLLYDCQHTYRHWHFVPNVKQDTMLAHHTMFAGMKKSLDFQASLYCDHFVYWKELHLDKSNKAGA